jgi:hypothetical protein
MKCFRSITGEQEEFETEMVFLVNLEFNFFLIELEEKC